MWGPIPLPLGYNLINWVAADEYGNLPRNNAIRTPSNNKGYTACICSAGSLY